MAVLLDGHSIYEAWTLYASSFSLQSGYRLFNRFEKTQSYLRALLIRLHPPPESKSSSPLAGLLEHFKVVFPLADCPFSHFQTHFLQGLLR